MLLGDMLLMDTDRKTDSGVDSPFRVQGDSLKQYTVVLFIDLLLTHSAPRDVRDCKTKSYELNCEVFAHTSASN